jgi:hypothetical protein
MPRDSSSRAAVYTLATLLALGAGCSAKQAHEFVASGSSKATTDDLASLALANIGGMACNTNSLGGSSFGSSCTGNGGQPEYWCADFVKWVWENNGVDVSGLSAAAGSFYVYGQNNGTLSQSPAVGDAVVFNYGGGGYADHVAIVTRVNGDGTIETASGDWNGQSGTEAYFSSTSHVVLNDPPYDGSVGNTPGVIGMRIDGYIAPVGVGAGSGGGAPPPPAPSGGGDACNGYLDGYYCGNDGPAGDPNTLYQCAGGATVGSQPCANGCQVNSGSQDDACNPGPSAPPPSGPDPCSGYNDGFYCGNDGPPGDPNTLYQCAGGVTVGSQPCPNGCISEPGPTDDQCR